jgi:REP element-mobilizing transposase RayT
MTDLTILHMCAIIKSMSSARSTVAATRPGGLNRQLGLTFRSWGGRRPGAGRPKRPDRGASHLRRPRLASRHPLHASLSVQNDLPSLRSPRLYRVVEASLAAGKERLGFRLVHFAVQKHHLHLIVEARDAQALAQGIKGLCVRIARHLNAALGRKGRVFADRYFARILRTPRETWAAVRYVILNSRRHGAQRRQAWDRDWIDPCSSGLWFDGWRDLRLQPPEGKPPPVVAAHSWLLRAGWKRHGLLSLDEVPGP